MHSLDDTEKNTHLAKKKIAWEIHMIRQNKQLNAIMNQGTTNNFSAQDISINTYQQNAENVWLGHSISDRKFCQIFEEGGDIFSDYYISASLFSRDDETYRVNPSLLNLKLVLEVSSDDIAYTAVEDIWSPSRRQSTKDQIDNFIFNLDKQIKRANDREAQYRVTFFKKGVTAKQLHDSTVNATNETENFYRNNSVKSISSERGHQLRLNPLITPQQLMSKNFIKEKPLLTKWNEVIIRKSNRYKIKAILISEKSMSTACRQAFKLGNECAIECLKNLSTTKVPIVLLNSNESHTAEEAFNPLIYDEYFRSLVKARNYHRLFKELLNYESNIISHFGGKALQEACYLGDLESIKLLLKYKVDPNFEDGIAFQAAVYRSYHKVFLLLLDYGTPSEKCLQKCKYYLQARKNIALEKLISKLTQYPEAIGDEEMADSAFGQSTNKAKKIYQSRFSCKP
ncbi:MAG: ankyrin repeat domain-containing protein [Legionellales bacterium]|nr:ankyrin repeat domain-containing protein [Legionellales bacterium]